MSGPSNPAPMQEPREDVEAQGETQALLAPDDTPPAPATTTSMPVRKRFSRRTRKLAITLLRITSTTILVVVLLLAFVVGPTLRSLRTQTSPEELQAIARRALIVDGSVLPSGEGDPTPVQFQIQPKNDTLQLDTWVCMGVDVQRAVDEWIAAPRAAHQPARPMTEVTSVPAMQVSHYLHKMGTWNLGWDRTVAYTALRQVSALQIQLGPTQIKKPLSGDEGSPEYKLDPILDEVCPEQDDFAGEPVFVAAVLGALGLNSQDGAQPLSSDDAGLFDITFEPILVPLRPIDGVENCGSRPSGLGSPLPLYPVHIRAHVVPLPHAQSQAQLHALPLLSSTARLTTDLHLDNLTFAALGRTEAKQAMVSWPKLPSNERKLSLRLSTWVNGIRGATDVRLSAPLSRALRCISGTLPDESNSAPERWWDHWAQLVDFELDSARLFPLSSQDAELASQPRGLAWRIAVQVKSTLFDALELDWPWATPVDVYLPTLDPSVGSKDHRALAQVQLLPFNVSHGSTVLTIQGEVPPLPEVQLSSSLDPLDRWLAHLVHGDFSPLFIHGSNACASTYGSHHRCTPPQWLCAAWSKVEHTLDVAQLATFLPPGMAVPPIKHTAFDNVSLRMHPFGPHKLTFTADFTAVVDLPPELDLVEVQLHTLWPDMIMISLPSEEEPRFSTYLHFHLPTAADPVVPLPADTTDLPQEPAYKVPDPLPEGAFAHVPATEWAASSLTWSSPPFNGSETERPERVLHAKFVDVPLDALPGMGGELRKFLWSVTRGDVRVGTRGEVGVRASVRALGPHVTTLLAVPHEANLTIHRGQF